jgi:hypothetical protein
MERVGYWRVEHHDDLKGRRLISCRRFCPGDLVLREAAYSWVILDEHIPSLCDCCLAPSPSSSPLLRQAARACYSRRLPGGLGSLMLMAERSAPTHAQTCICAAPHST